MKLPIQLFTLASMAALVSSPLAMADKSADGATAVEPAVEPGEAEPGDPGDELIEPGEELVDPMPTDDGEIVDGGDGEVTITVVDGEHLDGDGTCHEGHEGGVCEGEVPIDWVKRGEEFDEDLIFYTTMDGAPQAAELGGAGQEIVGEDDRASRIEENAGAAPLIQRQKKGPVALVKKGRVFLR